MIRRRRVAQRAFRIPAAVSAARARLSAINLHEISDGQRVPKRMICGRSSGAAGGSSARRDLNPQVGEISLDLDLNSKTGEESPDRGVHMKTVHLTGVDCYVGDMAKFLGAVTPCREEIEGDGPLQPSGVLSLCWWRC
jgi:hypothetical protein